MRRAIVNCLIVTIVCAFSTTAFAGAIINAAIDVGVKNDFEDLDVEHLIKGAGNTGGDLIVEKGDFFEGILLFQTINGQTTIAALFPTLGIDVLNYQLTAYFKLEVTDKVDLGGGLFSFAFAPAIDATTAVEVYENPDAAPGDSDTFDAETSVGDGISRAKSGTLLATLGFGASGDDFWTVAAAPDDLSVFSSASPAVSGANATYGLSLLTNPSGIGIATIAQGGGLIGTDGKLHDVIGTSELKNLTAGQEGAEWDVQTDTLIQFVGLPEPASMSLFCLGALAIGGYGFRRRLPRNTSLAP